MFVITNASPMIILSGIGLFSLLNEEFGELHTTQAVYDEVVSGGNLPGAREITDASDRWLLVHPTPPTKELRPYRKNWNISLPDASIYALAKKNSADIVVVDERRLRIAIQSLGSLPVGTGGMLVRFKEKGHIESVQRYLKAAINQGLYLDDDTKAQILALAHEEEQRKT